MGQFWLRNRDFIAFCVALAAIVFIAWALTKPPDLPILHTGPSSIEIPGNLPGGP